MRRHKQRIRVRKFDRGVLRLTVRLPLGSALRVKITLRHIGENSVFGLLPLRVLVALPLLCKLNARREHVHKLLVKWVARRDDFCHRRHLRLTFQGAVRARGHGETSPVSVYSSRPSSSSGIVTSLTATDTDSIKSSGPL